jgi:hypothetical protein
MPKNPIVGVGCGLRQEVHEFKGSLGNIARPCLQNKKKPTIWAVGVAQVVQCLPSRNKALSSKPWYNKKKQKITGCK